MVRRCYLRPHPSRAKARDTFPSRGRLSLRRVLRIEFERAGHAAAPTFVNDTAYRPSSGPFGTTFPQGKAILRTAGSDTRISDYTPSVATSVATAPPTQGSLTQSGQVPASNLGHSPSHGLRHDSPLSEGAKASAKVQSMRKKRCSYNTTNAGNFNIRSTSRP